MIAERRVAMIDEGDRLARAGHYVLGLMDDEERERAERDLERDGAFRDAVLSIAERMHVLDAGPAPDGKWRAISKRIAEMRQMRGVAPAITLPELPQTAGPKVAIRRVVGLHSVRGWRAALAAASLIAAFALGYVAGMSSAPEAPGVVNRANP
jgi:anti-sigma-K factor RskA